MRALRAYAKGDPSRLVYEEAPLPSLAADDVLVRVHASGVSPNELDWPGIWLDHDGRPRPLPIIPGHEVAGVVEQVGPAADGLAVGDAVYGLIDFRRDGADADYVAARASDLAPKPATLSHVQAAAVPLSALTAWQALFDHGRLRDGERVLIHGGAGGVGSFAVQLARWRGAHVLATASARDADLVRDLGADEVIDYERQDYSRTGQTYDVVIDAVNKTSYRRGRRVLRKGGLYLPTDVGYLAQNVPLVLWSKRFGDRKVIFGSMRRRLTRDDLLLLRELLETGAFRPVVDRAYPLEDVAEANRYVDSWQKTGNVVLTIDGGRP